MERVEEDFFLDLKRKEQKENKINKNMKYLPKKDAPAADGRVGGHEDERFAGVNLRVLLQELLRDSAAS